MTRSTTPKTRKVLASTLHPQAPVVPAADVVKLLRFAEQHWGDLLALDEIRKKIIYLESTKK